MALSKSDASNRDERSGSTRLFDALSTRERWWLGGVVAAAFVLRLVVAFRMGTIDSEGAEYARIAENLATGHGYTGLVTPGKNLIFPPLYPCLLALGTLLSGSAELTGRAISIVMGSVLVVLIYLVTRDLYGKKAAPFASMMAALHPMLIGFAASVYCETTYMTLQLLAVYLCLRVFREPTARGLVLAGVVLGAAYLVRPEAGLYALLASSIVALLALARRQGGLVAGKHAVSLFLAFAVLAAPYVLWLHAQSGQWRLEGKSSLNYATQRMMDEGAADMFEASYRVSPELQEQGIWLKAHATTMKQVNVPVRALPRYLTAHVKAIANFIKNTLASGGVLGAPPIFALSLLGLFGVPWSRHVALGQFLIFCMMVATGSALFFINYLSPRFLITYVPFLSVWAGAGVIVLGEWLEKTWKLLREKPLPIPLTALQALVVVGVALSTVGPARELYEIKTFAGDARPVREAGEWLARYAQAHREATAVTDSQDVLPYHARASTYVPLPYADASTTLRYLKSKHIRFIALHDADNFTRPYLATWLKDGIVGNGARLIYNRSSPALGRILIYELTDA